MIQRNLIIIYDIKKILFSKGAETTANNEGWTPLHHAASMGHALVISTILSRVSSSSSALSTSTSSFSSAPTSNSSLSLSLSAASLSLVNARDKLGRTPIFLAAAGGRIIYLSYLYYIQLVLPSFVLNFDYQRY